MTKGVRAILAGILICLFAWQSEDSLLFPWYVKLAIGISFLLYGIVLAVNKK